MVYPRCSTVRRTKHSHRTNVFFDEDVIPASARLEQVREELGDVELLADGAEAAAEVDGGAVELIATRCQMRYGVALEETHW